MIQSNSTHWDPWATSAKEYCENLNDSSKDTLEDWDSQFRSMMVGFHVYYYVIIVTGVFGNSLVIYIYGRKSQKTTASQFILFLGVTDLFVCLVVTPLSLHEVYSKFTAFNESRCAFYEYLHHLSLAISCITLGCIALYRYVAICKPLHYNMHSHQAKYMMVISVMMGCVLEIPILFLAGLERTELPDALLGCVCYWKEEYSGTYVYLIFQCFQLALQLSLAICICVLYGFVYRVVKDREKKRRRRNHFGGESVIGTQAVTDCIGNQDVGLNITGAAIHAGVLAAGAVGATCNSQTVDEEVRNPETSYEEAKPDGTSILGQGIQDERNGKDQTKCISPEKVESALNLVSTRRVRYHHVLEDVKEDSKGEREDFQNQESEQTPSNSVSSIVSRDSNAMLHVKDDGKENARDTETLEASTNVTIQGNQLEAHVGAGPDIAPQTSDAQQPQGLHAGRSSSWGLRVQSARVHPLERCTSVDQSTANLLRMQAHARFRSRYKTAQMLVLVTVVFFVTWIPYWCITLYVFLKPEFYKEKDAWELNIIKILRHSYLVNNATNPVIYTFANKQFRDEIKEVFSCKKCHK